jgi:hypothetical protein
LKKNKNQKIKKTMKLFFPTNNSHVECGGGAGGVQVATGHRNVWVSLSLHYSPFSPKFFFFMEVYKFGHSDFMENPLSGMGSHTLNTVL